MMIRSFILTLSNAFVPVIVYFMMILLFDSVTLDNLRVIEVSAEVIQFFLPSFGEFLLHFIVWIIV